MARKGVAPPASSGRDQVSGRKQVSKVTTSTDRFAVIQDDRDDHQY